MRYIIGIPLGALYMAFGILVGLFLKYRTEYHVRKFGDVEKHDFCWCKDNELPGIVRWWVGWSFLVWPINLAVFAVVAPAIKCIIIPAFRFVLIPLFVYLVVRPVRFFSECYSKVTELAANTVFFEASEANKEEARRKAEEADRKKHEKVDGAMARADALLKRVDDRVGGPEEE